MIGWLLIISGLLWVGWTFGFWKNLWSLVAETLYDARKSRLDVRKRSEQFNYPAYILLCDKYDFLHITSEGELQFPKSVREQESKASRALPMSQEVPFWHQRARTYFYNCDENGHYNREIVDGVEVRFYSDGRRSWRSL